MSLIREIRDFNKFFEEKNAKRRSLVFYSENRFYYQHYERIINRILDNTNIIVDFITSDSSDPVFEKDSERFRVYLCNKLLASLIAQIKTKALVFTMTDLGSFHIKKSGDTRVNHMYIFHAPASTTMMYRKGAFDSYDTIFCPGPKYKAEIRKNEQIYNLPHKKLVDAGYPLLEKRYKKYKSHASVRVNDQKTVLIAPSWHDNNLIEVCGEPLIRNLLSARLNVVLRPHPQTLVSKFRKRKIDPIVKLFSSNDKFTFEKNSLENASFYLSDVLISDWSSIALEYAWATERPVLFINTPKKVFNPEYKKIGIEPIEVALRNEIGIVLQTNEISTIAEKVNELIANKKHYSKIINESRDKNIYNFGHSHEIIADYIIEFCKNNNKLVI